MQKFVVTKQEEGWRFDKYLKKLLPEAGGGFLYKMLRKKNITLNEKKAAGNEVIAVGDSVELFFSEETFLKFSGGVPEQKENVQTGDGEKRKTAGRVSGGERQREEGQTSGRERYGKAGRLETAAEQKKQEEIYRLYRKAFRTLKNISVIYEDDNILVLNKPAGVLSQKADRVDLSLNEWMIGYLLDKGEITEEELARFRPSVCNRLDRNTSGLVLCGKSVRSSQFLSEILRDRSLHKYYTAYAQGRIEQEITLDGYLKKEEEKNRAKILSETAYRRLILEDAAAGKEYKRIKTVIKPLSYLKERDCTKLEILLVTGKSHQIRAHLAGIGHPVIGDRKYGWKPGRKEEAVFTYQLLHACRVEFPETDGEFAYLSGKCLTAPLPQEWEIFPALFMER